MQVHFEALLLAGNCCKTYKHICCTIAGKVIGNSNFFPLVFPSLYT